MKLVTGLVILVLSAFLGLVAGYYVIRWQVDTMVKQKQAEGLYERRR